MPSSACFAPPSSTTPTAWTRAEWLGFFERDDTRFDPARVLEQVRAINAWYTNDEPVTLTPQYVSVLLAHAGDPRSEYWDLMKNETIPPSRYSPAACKQ